MRSQGRLNKALRSSLVWGAAGVMLALVLFYLLSHTLSPLQKFKFPWSTQAFGMDQGEMLLLWALVPTLLVGIGFSRSGLATSQRLLSFALRAGFFVCLIFGLGRPLREVPSERLCQLGLLDVSQSVSDRDLGRALQQLKTIADQKRSGDSLHLLAFAEASRLVTLSYDEQGKLLVPTLAQLRQGLSGEGTNLQQALEHGLLYAGSDCHNRFFVFSDGIETRQSALSFAAQLIEKGISVVAFPFEQSEAKDVAVTFVGTEGEVRVGEPFRVRVEVAASKPGRGQLRLYQDEVLTGLKGVKTVDLPVGTSSFTFDSVVRVGGKVSYRAQYVPESLDAFSANNQYVIALSVPGPPTVLVVDRRPAQISHLVDVLVAQQFDVDVRGADAFPRSLSELAAFEFVVLSDLSRSDLSRGGEVLVERYVRSGGGLLVSGGEAGYGPGGWQNSSLEKILPVRMDAQKEREIPGVAMSLVIDRSGSMTGLPLTMAKEACIATLDVLEPSDLIEVIAFDSRPTSYVPLQPARYRLRIEEAVSRIQPGGGTEIFNSLDKAYQSLSAVEARRKHIILLTDGNASSDGIYELASTVFAEGITITSIGLGAGVNQSLLTMIAEAGGGRFVTSDDPARLPRIFTRETELISTKPTLEDWFPVRVVKQVDFLDGVDLRSAPLLRGYTSTQLAPPPSELILESDRGEPILARRPVGLGWTLAWTSDFKARWATDFLRFRHLGPFLAQLIRRHQKSSDTEVRPMQVSLRGDEVLAQVEAFDEGENFENDLQSTLDVRRHSDKDQQGSQALPTSAPSAITSFVSIAPGLYQATYRLPGPGAYSLQAVHRRISEQGVSQPAGLSFASISLPYPEEYRDLKPRVADLQALAKLTGGALAVGEEVPKLTSSRQVMQREQRQHEFILAAILLFFLDLLVRRVRLFDSHFKRSGA